MELSTIRLHLTIERRKHGEFKKRLDRGFLNSSSFLTRSLERIGDLLRGHGNIELVWGWIMMRWLGDTGCQEISEEKADLTGPQSFTSADDAVAVSGR